MTRERLRATFDRVASRYQQARPDYPADLRHRSLPGVGEPFTSIVVFVHGQASIKSSSLHTACFSLIVILKDVNTPVHGRELRVVLASWSEQWPGSGMLEARDTPSLLYDFLPHSGLADPAGS